LNIPYGVITDSLGVALGSTIGCLLKEKLPEKFRSSFPVIFGILSMAMGVISIQKVFCLPAVALSIIVGYTLATLIRLEETITEVVAKVYRKVVNKKNCEDSSSCMNLLIGIIPLFCASGTGIYGAMNASFTGDHSYLIVKTMLDFCTAMIFGALIGRVVILIAIPQFTILLTVFFLSGLILPATTSEMIMDFTACGGVIMLATGFRIGQIKNISTVNLLPALLLVMPFSYLYTLIF
jgi:uncharacterized membrane protein YqgA involved in biofilm formation